MAKKKPEEMYQWLAGRTRNRPVFDAAADEFRKRGLTSVEDVLQNFARLTNQGKFAALCLFAYAKHQPAVPLLLRQLTSWRTGRAGTAAGALASVGGTVVRSELLGILNKTRSRQIRLLAINAIGNLTRPVPAALIESLARFARDPRIDIESRNTATTGCVQLSLHATPAKDARRIIGSVLKDVTNDQCEKVRIHARSERRWLNRCLARSRLASKRKL